MNSNLTLKVNNVSYKYGQKLAVNNLSFELKGGEIFGLLGSNGSGKTTTFRMLMGLMPPLTGNILYNDHKVSYDDSDEIGFLIEERTLMPKKTVQELAYFFGKLKNLKADTINERLDYWLKRFNIFEYKFKKIKELSKGNQQKIQFIYSILNNPKLLILDEPFSGLDVIATKEFVSVINDFKNNGSMIIFSSHQIDQVESFCEKIVVLEKGETILNGYIKDIKEDFKKKNILIEADDIDIEKIKNIKGVYEVIQNANNYEVKVEDNNVSKKIFEYLKTLKNVRKYDVQAAKLSDIFIETIKKYRGV